VSSSIFTLHAGPAAGFDAPFELMAACHERMARTLALLLRLGEHLATHGGDDQARDAARDVLRYFRVAAPLHHQDEELHVVPRLRLQGREALADRLLAEHRDLARAWATIEPDLEAVLDDALGGIALTAARERWAAFSAMYRQHIEVEDGEAYPAASDSLAEPALRSMGEEMAARRRV
jgi:hemerythrin-like domain-containing protein